MDDLPFPEVFAVDSFTTANSKYQQEKHRSFINKWFFFCPSIIIIFFLPCNMAQNKSSYFISRISYLQDVKVTLKYSAK